jgi:hypothetical protein
MVGAVLAAVDGEAGHGVAVPPRSAVVGRVLRVLPVVEGMGTGDGEHAHEHSWVD